MSMITYIEADGQEYKIDVPAGNSVMQGAVDNMLDGIVAQCGGNGSCATCHCYVDEDWIGQLGEPDDMEVAMLEAVSNRLPNSRLSCQLEVTEQHNGMVVRLPESQDEL